MGTTLDSIFLHRFFFSVRVQGPWGYPNEKLLRYDQRSYYIILWKLGHFCESKLLWALKFIFDRFFRRCEIRSKVAFIMASVSFYAEK